jgi:hypothetical protein
MAGHLVSGFVWGSEASVTSGYHFGVSYYTRVSRLFARVPYQGQAGLFGQWIQDFNIHESESPFNSIEGGLFTHDKLGRSCYPKYMIGASTHLYNPNSDTSGGWGFLERALQCDYLARIQLTNRLLIPPNGLAFDKSQEAYESSGGIYLGE